MNTNSTNSRTVSKKRPEDLGTPEEAAQLLGVTAATVRRMANRGTLPVVRLGYRTVRFSRAALRDAVAQRAGGTEEAAAGSITLGEAEYLRDATVRALLRARWRRVHRPQSRTGSRNNRPTRRSLSVLTRS